MRARRLACRYWAGRVALRENRAPTHRLTAPRRSEAGAPKCLGCAPPAPGCRAVRTARSRRGILLSTHLAREGRMTVTIGRRELLVALGGAAATRPLGAHAQQPAMPGAADRRTHERGCGRYGRTGSHRCVPQGWLR